MMKYINERILLELGIEWPTILSIIKDATILIKNKDFCQPVKPYLRFNNLSNRIIAMPAYAGGQFNSAGIKWIASFPGNIEKGIKRAHSVIILNDTETGFPIAMINTPLISGIRTAGVSGFVLKQYLEINDVQSLTCGIIGFGPIGQLHLQMLEACFGDKLERVLIYDPNLVDREITGTYKIRDKIMNCSRWEDVYEESNLFITCTVSKERYVHATPKKGGIYLNISLRDFQPHFLEQVDVHVVDNWDEVCRENTDIEKAHLQFGLAKDNVLEMPDILDAGNLTSMAGKSFMFNPMGMAIFDISVAKYYYDLALSRNNFIGIED
jgi:N-[(2S)-2-amino-2-carboxyethyl]-L-glutamate dehydrogenase